MNAPKILARELTLFALAALLAVVVARVLPPPTTPSPEPVPTPVAGLTFPNPADAPPGFERATLRQRLRDGDPVLLGSSELAFGGETAPHLYFPKACGRPMLTIGRAGFRSLPMMLTLAEVEDALNARTDLTIILSPGWFAEFGTPSGAFLKYLKRDALRELFRRPDLSREVRDVVARQIRTHRDEFSGLYPDWLFPWVPALAYFTPITTTEVFEVPRVAPEAPNKFDWDEAEEKWRQVAKDAAKGNPYGTASDYFEHNKNKLPKKPASIDNWDVERRDLFKFSKFLRDHGTHARFIVQPLHRRVYRDLEYYDARLAYSVRTLTADGHRVVNLGREPYDLQLLEDSVHFNGYGWVKVQREICER